jgi:hypothetical protein
VKLIPRKAGNGYVGNYHISIGAAEARRLGFVDEEGTRYDLTKEIDYEAGTVTYRLTKEQPTT